jgi:hypothetical protein
MYFRAIYIIAPNVLTATLTIPNNTAVSIVYIICQ